MPDGPSSLNGQLPRIPEPSPDLETTQATAELLELRRFHAGVSEHSTAELPRGVLPALVHPLRDSSLVRTDYPLFLFAPDGTPMDDGICAPLAELLQRAADAAFPGTEQARILKDNLPRLERQVKRALGGAGGAVDASATLREAGRALQDELALGEENAERLRQDSEALFSALPAGGQLLGLTEQTTAHLLLAAVRARCTPRWATFRAEVSHLCDQLQALVDVDRAKDPSSRTPDALAQAVGDHFDPTALAEVMGPHCGSQALDPVRRQRIEAVLVTLRAHLAEPEPQLSILCAPAIGAELDLVDPHGAPAARLIESDDPCAEVAAQFDREAARHAEVFRSVRTGQLELAGQYDPAVHDLWLEQLNWEAFSREELLLVPPAVAFESVEQLAGERMLVLSRLLRSGRPVQVLVMVDPGRDPGDDRDAALTDYRLELGYLGMGHREALVHQSTAARPRHVAVGFARALDATRTAMHVVTSAAGVGGLRPRLGPWLHAGAALEGRAHPIYLYDPEAGATWSRRLDFTGNAQPEEDWPVQSMVYSKPDGSEGSLELAFTFADFALLEPIHAAHFRPIPDGLQDEALVPLAHWLQQEADQALATIPFVWAVDEQGRLRRLAVTRRMTQACRDRLSFWRTLQELAGIRNDYARLAADRVREETRAVAEANRLEREATHAAELAAVRGAAAGEAMHGLAQLLLEGDLDALAMPGAAVPLARAAPAPSGAPVPEPPTVEAAAQESAAPEVAEEAEDDVSFDDPWVDTPLCTSCNDCVNLNPRMFTYDDNKQAVMGDPRSGPYAQIVEAAELCPAKCIHPGKPLDSSEPNLEELMERAAPFN